MQTHHRSVVDIHVGDKQIVEESFLLCLFAFPLRFFLSLAQRDPVHDNLAGASHTAVIPRYASVSLFSAGRKRSVLS